MLPELGRAKSGVINLFYRTSGGERTRGGAKRTGRRRRDKNESRGQDVRVQQWRAGRRTAKGCTLEGEEEG